MTAPCLLAATATGVLVAALSDLLPAAHDATARRGSEPSLARQPGLRRFLHRSLLFAASTTILALALQLKCGQTPSLAGLLEVAQVGMFLMIAVIDVEHRRIVPLSLVLAAALTLALAAQSDALATSLTGGIVGLLAGSLLYAGGRLYRRAMLRLGRVLPGLDPFGAADALLAGLCGLYAGWPLTGLALLLGVLCAGAAALALLLAGKATLRSTLPLAPFLLAGALLATRFRDAATWLAGLIA